MPLPARACRILAASAAGLLAVGATGVGILVLVLTAVLLLVQTPDGRQALAKGLDSLLAGADGAGVHIRGIGPGLPARLQVERIEVADAAGTWLAIDDLMLSWRPWALLGGRLRVDELSAAAIDVARLPAAAQEAAPPEPHEGPPELPRLPIAVRVDRLAVGGLTMGEAVAGRPLRLGIDGRLAAADPGNGAGGQVRTALSVVPLDGSSGAILLDASLDPQTRNLDLQAAIEEPEGGLVSGLVGLAPLAPLAVHLAGAGPLDRWQGNLDASAGGLGRLALALTLHWSRDIRLVTAGTADFERPPLPQLAPALAAGVRLEAAVRQGADGTLAVDALQVTGDGARVSGEGSLAPDGALAFIGNGTVEERALAAGTAGPVRFSTLTVNARAGGSMQAPTVDASAVLADLIAPGARSQRLDVEVRGALAPPGAEAASAGARVEAAGVLAGLVLDDAALRAAVGDAPRFALVAGLDAAKTTATLQSLTLDGRAVRLAGSGTLGLEDHRLAARVDLGLDDLRTVAATAGSPASGGAGLAATIDGTLQPLALKGTVSGGGRGLATGIPAVDALLGSEPRLDAPFAWDERAGLDVPALTLTARNITGAGHLRLPPGGGPLDARLRFDVPTLAPLSAALGSPLQGRLALEAEARGATADPQASAVLRLQDAAVGTTRIAALTADLRAADLVTRPNGRLTIDGRSDLGPLSASSQFALQDGRYLHLAGITARALGIAIDGDARTDLTAGPLTTGRIRIASQDPASGIRWGETALSGPLNLDVLLTPERAQQTVGVRLQGGPLSLRQGAAEQLAIAGLSGSATVEDAIAHPRFEARVQADGISGPATIAGARVTADGTPERMRVTASGEGQGAAPDRLAAAASISRVADALRVDLDRLDGRLAGEDIRLSQPARITSSAGLLKLEGLGLAIGTGSLAADARLGPGQTSADLRLEALPLAMARVLAPAAPSQGTLASRLTLRSERGDTVGDGRIELRGAGFDDSSAVGADARADGDVTLRLGGGTLNADAALVGPEGSRVTLVARLPVRLPAGAMAPVINRNGPIDGRLGVDADIAKVSRLLALADQRMEGKVQGDLAVDGTLADPQLRGAIDLSNGLYENFVSGTLLNGLTAHIEPRQRRALAFRLSGGDGGAGHVSADGEAAMAEGGGAPAVRLNLRADNATLVRRDDVTATLDADIAYTGEGGPPRLAGRIESREIIVNLVNRLPPAVVELPVIEIGRPRYWRAEAEAAEPPVAINLDLAVSLPRRVFVRGRGLESEWSGNLTITGSSSAPSVVGQVDLVRGTFSFASKRFTLDRGIVTFTGGKKIDPFINAQAEYKSSDITAYIGLTGLASNPEITITSQPPMPQSEVLSLVMFGKNSTKLGPVEAVQLAAALDTLARGESTGDNALDFVRTLLGLDTLTVQPSRSGEGSSVAVGSYVGDSVYIGAERGLTDQSQTGTVEIEIAPGISIESEIGQRTTTGTQGALGLKWKLDY